MILEEATKEAFGYYSSELSAQSGKPILAACDGCGKVREMFKYAYRALCKSCAHKGEKAYTFGITGKKHPLFGKIFTDEHKANMSKNHANCKGKNHPMFGKKQTEATKALISAANKGKYAGENHPQWLGGINFEPYCIKFNNEYKEMIRERFGNECFLCGKSKADNGKKLDVHHVNYNKNCGRDETKCICVPLCHCCHSKTNPDRDFWQCLIMEMLKPLEAWE